ncbi:hypothetical protein GCM10010300_72000 [Streptomyces olivaceoviridis]|nr:hypothetical protein GCM10010300_72000 [Streptomyces olivaceoviridis]
MAGGFRPHHSPLGIGWTAVTAAVMSALAADEARTGTARTGTALDDPLLKTEGTESPWSTACRPPPCCPAAGYVHVYYALREVKEIFFGDGAVRGSNA